ncbi:MAG: DNA repair protein RecN [Bacteroidales bacterium]|nr:DNA repair protein RecN [Bacteroidales bacterium]
MLGSLHIRNYILIDSLDIDFPESLVIITGQTGAGKSILLGALSLVTGGKADASMILEGADNCIVEAEFHGAGEDIRAILDDNDVEWDDGHLIIRRVLNSSGRSRCFVNDCPVPVGLLSSIASFLVDIHSQNRSLLLTDHNFQMSILDCYAGNSELLAVGKSTWQRIQAIQSEIGTLKDKLSHLNAESDYNIAQLRQLEAASLKVGELEELEAEQKSLEGAEQIKESFSTISRLFNPADDDSGGIGPSLKEAGRQLERVSRFIPAAGALASRLESARIELEDILSEAEGMDRKVDLSPEHLEEIDDRLSLLYTLLKKHSCTSIAELIQVRDTLKNGTFDAEEIEDRLKGLEKELSAARSEYERIAGELHSSRLSASEPFAQSILEDLRFLELEHSVFKIELQPCNPGASGRDAVSFLFSASGSNPQDVSRCASGGELSRIMLSLKAMMAKFVGMPTLVFDEIDTGVSGSVADRMGQMICRMGADMQVFSITHLPQVAAKGNAHYVVTKKISGSGRAVSSIRRVTGEERVNEIARLLSGTEITDAALANARVLLDQVG